MEKTRYIWAIVFLAVICCDQQLQAQDNTVSGKVIDKVTHQPLPGVNILLRGTTTGTATNLDGEYEISVSSLQDTLIFSFIGYKTQVVPVRGRPEINITLKPKAITGEELVVVGYGMQEKISVTGAISQVIAPDENLGEIVTPSLTNTLAGKIPGLITRQRSGEPGYAQAQIFIRGQSTFGNNNPLVLVDGVPRSMNDINPQQIASMTVLKDASATAVYGARGANGVILIKTKRGQPGKPQVTFRTEVGRLAALRLPDYIGGAAYANLVNEANTHVGLSPVYTKEDIRKYRSGKYPYTHPNVNWTDVVLKKHTWQTINNLSISGGNDRLRYYANVAYTSKSGIYKQDKSIKKYGTNAKIQKYNFRANLNANVTEDISLFLGLGAVVQDGHYPGRSAPDIFRSLKIISPIEFPVTNPDGSVAGGPSYLGNNPWGMVTQSGYATQEWHQIQSTFEVNWDLSSLVTKGLSVSGKFAYDYYNFSGVYRGITYELKEYLGKNESGEDEYKLIREASPMAYDPGTYENNRTFYIEAALRYNRTFFGKHDIGAMLLFNQREHLDLIADNEILGLPYRSRGIAGRVTYGYDNRYMVAFNFGYNGSENFPEGHRYGFFPSVSGGWVISNEKFWDVPFINLLKVRASYGAVGNDQIVGQRFLFLTAVKKYANTYWFGKTQQAYSGFDEGNIGNPNVSWEIAIKANIGLDVELLDGKISLQVDAFHELRKNILLQRQTIPMVTGYFPWIVPYGNLGRVKNVGFDGRLKIRNTTSGGLYYSFVANFTYAHNTVLANDEPTKKFPYQSAIGHSLGAPFGLIALGFFDSKQEIRQSPEQAFSSKVYPGDIRYKDVNGDGVINNYDRVYLDGYPRTPEITFGLGGTVAWKGFELSVFFTGATHTSLFLSGPSIYPFARGPGTYNILEEYYNNRWTPETKKGALYPAVTPGENTNNFRPSTIYMRDASYIRLKSAGIAYTIPATITENWNISSCRFFINGVNLLTFDKIGFMNPEADNGTGGYPIQRSVNVGLEIHF